VYRAITRGLFNFTIAKAEVGGSSMTRRLLIDMIRRTPAVRDVAIVAFADRRAGVGLYAFVEADQRTLESQLRSELAVAKGPRPPEHIQVVRAFRAMQTANLAPSPATGRTNQIDLIEPMMTSEADRTFLKIVLESRKNLRDRFNFESEDLKFALTLKIAATWTPATMSTAVRNLDGDRGVNGSLSARDIRTRSRRTAPSGKKHRPQPAVAPSQANRSRPQMPFASPSS